MYSQLDFNQIDHTYFNVLQLTDSHIILKSKNTKHIWDINQRELQVGKSYIVILHKHKESDPFHEQPMMHPKSVREAQEMIKDHDQWHLNNR